MGTKKTSIKSLRDLFVICSNRHATTLVVEGQRKNKQTEIVNKISMHST
jgi:hypothetical protein